MADEECFSLHESVFTGDVRKLSALLRIHPAGTKDKHGNTPLHIAVMLGRKECVHLLLAHGAPVHVKNILGWSPLAEAVSYGDRQTISSILRKMKQQARERMDMMRPNLVTALSEMGDFYMEVKWDFQSWLPLVSRMLPSDICRIHKSGTKVRLDTTVVELNDVHWKRGDITVLFNGDCPPKKSFIILDNQLKVYQRVRYEENESDLEEELDVLMSSDIVAAQISTKCISFTRSQSGFIFREDRKRMVGPFEASFYSMNGIFLESRKRREHLSKDDLRKNKLLMESLIRGDSEAPTVNEEWQRRQSLTPPPPCTVTWKEYLEAAPGCYPSLGRPIVCKESCKSFKATVAMSPDFPLTLEMLLNVFEIMAPFKHFQKLREFIRLKFPPGFPVKIDIPIVPTVSAKITFQEFQFRDDIDPGLFKVPPDYDEDSTRLMTPRSDDVGWIGLPGEPRDYCDFGVAVVKTQQIGRDVRRKSSPGLRVSDASDPRLQLFESLRFVPGTGKIVIPWLVLDKLKVYDEDQQADNL